jgi:flavin reductase (DIM6/NTAB) family NADH-FMN oxidoreductase RutF
MTETDPDLSEAFRQAMRRVASTVNVISICVNGEPLGITATAFSVISMDPPSLLICIN